MVDLRPLGLINPGTLHANLAPAALVEQALRRHEGLLAANGALVALTGKYTGRAPQDKFFVAEAPSKDQIAWGKTNQPMEPAVFERLLGKALAYLQGRELFVLDGWACADPKFRLPVRVVTEQAWQSLFARCLLLRPPAEALSQFHPEFNILDCSGMQADPAHDGTRSEVFIVVSFERRLVLIGGTQYAGEIKKSVFTLLNYLLPQQGVFPMHCSANIGATGDTALFFGLSGTGKTTLSADPERHLIGDDEHAWSDDGIFNIEGGCYAKTIRLSREGEPQIWNALRFGSILENVPLDPLTRQPDYDSHRHTENTRGAYPLDFIDNAVLEARGGHPANIVFLTCDAFGVMPPLGKLTPDQALFHFLSGYTAKVAGTETGVTEPQATFSTCFAAPFLPLDPTRYADLLLKKLNQHGAQVWLVNTGWSGGPYGVGKRMALSHTRTLLRAALSGGLANATFAPDPIFGVLVPESCPGVPSQVLKPRGTWPNPAEYDARARHLAQLFQKNFQSYAARTTEGVRQAGPRG